MHAKDMTLERWSNQNYDWEWMKFGVAIDSSLTGNGWFCISLPSKTTNNYVGYCCWYNVHTQTCMALFFFSVHVVRMFGSQSKHIINCQNLVSLRFLHLNRAQWGGRCNGWKFNASFVPFSKLVTTFRKLKRVCENDSVYLRGTRIEMEYVQGEIGRCGNPLV